MKKITIILVIIALICGACVGSFFFFIAPVSKTREIKDFKVIGGKNKIEIVTDLKKEGLIKSKYAALAYLFFTRKGLQSGDYEIDKSKSAIEILNNINKGLIKNVQVTVQIQFEEGIRFVDYAKLISDNFPISYETILEKGKDPEFLQTVINSYWFVDESILDDKIYYPLEGYLFPDTYEVFESTTIENLFYKLLNNTKSKLDPLKEDIQKGKYNVHEILTLASIIEKEARKEDERKKVSQVLYKRLDNNISLGCDVTSYYGVHKTLKDPLAEADLYNSNPYNTRATGFMGLPVGPICMPSLMSIKAALNPADTDYLYFCAGVKSGIVSFAKNTEEWLKIKPKCMSER